MLMMIVSDDDEVSNVEDDDNNDEICRERGWKQQRWGEMIDVEYWGQ